MTGGYLAFPISAQTLNQKIDYVYKTEAQRLAQEADIERTLQEAKQQSDNHERQKLDNAWAERLRIETERRVQIEAREREQALIGEMNWVRAGGTLRDENGRRDLVRTEKVRQLVKEEDERRAAQERWYKYEAALNSLGGSSGTLTFATIPWPTKQQPADISQLTTDNISAFLFETLKGGAGTKVAKKARVVSSLLRWHPDKMAHVLARVIEADREVVREGINTVAMCLVELTNPKDQKIIS